LLQYKQVGRWRNYLTGERTYILLSLLAKILGGAVVSEQDPVGVWLDEA
jgi:hypothetical protein